MMIKSLFVKLSLFAALLSVATATTPSQQQQQQQQQQQGYQFLRRQGKDASAVHHHHHQKKNKDLPRSLQDTPPSPQVISFDGDLDRIVQLALERASGTMTPSAMPSTAPVAVPAETTTTEDSTTPTTTTTQAPTESPSLSSITNDDAPTLNPASSFPPVLQMNMCPGAILNRLVLVGWKYTIETAPTADPSQVIGEVEEILQESLIPIVLSCNINNNNNELGAVNNNNPSIVAIDSTLPRDSISDNAVCAPEVSPSNVCTVIDGIIRIFLSDPGQNEEAQEMMKQAIEAVVNGPDFVDRVGTGLVKINILEDDTSSLPAENENTQGLNPEDDKSLEPNNESGFGTVSVVILAVGGAALIAFVGTFYYWRHGQEGDGNATQMAGQSTMVDSDTQPPPSPFSEMLPRAYKFNDSISILTGQGDHMSPITERSPVTEQNEDSHNSSCETPSVIMSDFSTDPDTTANSFDMGSTSTTSISAVQNTSLLVGHQPAQSPDVLGARKRADGDTNPVNALDLQDSVSAIDSQLSIDTPLVTNTSGYNNNNSKTLLMDTGDLKSVQEKEELEDDSLLFLSQLDAPQVNQPALVAATDSEESDMTTGAAPVQQDTMVVQDSGVDDNDQTAEEPALVDTENDGNESDKGSELV